MSGKIASVIKPKFFVIVTILAFIGVLGLYFYAIVIEPEELAIGDIGLDDVGLTITTRGFIKDLRLGSALHITLIDVQESKSIMVYVPLNVYEELSFKSDLLPGAEIKVKADVSDYNGKIELYVRTSNGLELLSKSISQKIDMEMLAQNPELFNDLNVTVEGQVISIENFYDHKRNLGTVLILKNGEYRLECVAYGIKLNDELPVGSVTILTGTFEYKESELRYILVLSYN